MFSIYLYLSKRIRPGVGIRATRPGPISFSQNRAGPILTETDRASKNRAETGLTQETEPDDSQPDPDCPDNLEPGPNAHPWFQERFFILGYIEKFPAMGYPGA